MIARTERVYDTRRLCYGPVGEPLRLRPLGCFVCILVAFFANCVFGQRMDSFEGGEPRWELVESDCQAQLTSHEISQIAPRSGATCEIFEVACTPGTMVLLAYPIEPCAVLNEFQPQIWTRCSSGRIQLGVRVIFPFAAHPVTGGRMSAILWGNYYSDTGQWQTLQVENMTRAMRDETVSLRKRFGADLKLDGAYIDSLVLNVYTGPGRYRVQVDDLDLRGMIPMASIGNPPPADWRERWQWRYEVPSDEERFWASPNRAPIWLQYRGEPLPWVESLGFTGIVRDSLPSIDDLAAAQRANLGVICPPPPYPIDFPTELQPTLKGWLIGAALDTRQAEAANSQVRSVAKLPVELRKPLVAEALEDFFLFSRVADELIVPIPLASSAGSEREKADWLAEKLAITKQRSDGWVSIHLDTSPSLQNQIDTAAELLTPSTEFAPASPPETRANPLGLRHRAFSAMMSGAKGMLLRTHHLLDIQQTSDRVNVSALRWINNEFKLLGPWMVAGQRLPPPVLNDPDWACAAWSLHQSQLVVAQTVAPGSQHCLPPTGATLLQFGASKALTGQQVFRLTHGTLERIDVEPSPAGIAWNIERPATTEIFLITSNAEVIKFARQQLSAMAEQNAADLQELTAYHLTLASQLVAARFPALLGPAAPTQAPAQRDAAASSQQRLALAERQLQNGGQALRSRQPTAAMRLTYQAADTIQGILFEGFLDAMDGLATAQSSPLVATPGALSLHWELARACQRSSWQAVDLPGGELASLNAMVDSGWIQQRRLEDKVDLRVELIPASDANPPGLRMAAYTSAADPSATVRGGYEGASLRILTAGVPVQAGQLIRVAATATVLNAGQSVGSGLMVFDNQVGPGLGQLVRGTAGQQIPVELYRFIAHDGEFRLLAECRGECDIILGSIELSVIEPATNRHGFFTIPRNE